MGSPANEPAREADEGPQQQVVFGRMFAVGRSAVTFDEWNACVAEGGCNAYRPGDYGWGRGKRPVINVSWNDAQAYVKWLSAKTGAPYRLLSEAEREYVTRGCASSGVPVDAVLVRRRNFSRSRQLRLAFFLRWKRQGAAAAAHSCDRRLRANPFGLFQVHGNVREWVEDCWNANLSGLPRDGTARTTGDCSGHVVRGGSWADEPKDLRSAKRSLGGHDRKAGRDRFPGGAHPARVMPRMFGQLLEKSRIVPAGGEEPCFGGVAMVLITTNFHTPIDLLPSGRR